MSLRRTGGPKRNVEGIRAWQEASRERARERAREAQARGDAREARGLKRGRPKTKARIPPGIRAKAKGRTLGACFVCLHREGIDPHVISVAALEQLGRRGVIRPAAHVHHILDEQKWPHLAEVLENLAGVCPDCHFAHHFAPNGRIPREALPACAVQLAEREGLGWYVERTYPVREADAQDGDRIAPDCGE